RIVGRLRRRHFARRRHCARDSIARRNRSSGRRSRFSRNARRLQRCSGWFSENPVAVRFGHRRKRRTTRHPPPSDRTLLRCLPDARPLAQDRHFAPRLEVDFPRLPAILEIVMPTYMDIHEIPGGVKAEDVAKAHAHDVEVQGKYGVNYHKYWINEKEGKKIGRAHV